MSKSVARVGAAAFVLGLSVAGPHAIAVADSGDSVSGRGVTSSSASPSGASSSVTAHRGARGKGRSPVADDSVTTGPAAARTGVVPAPAAASASAGGGRAAGRGGGSGSGPVIRASAAPVVEIADAVIRRGRSSAPSALPEPAAATGVSSSSALPAAASTGSSTGSETAAPQPIDGDRPIGPIETVGVTIVTAVDRMDTAIYGVLDAAAKWLSGLPATPVTEFLQGSLLLVRRNFFDQPPTVNPLQLTGQVDGPITGTIGAVDPEKEAITYSVVNAPAEGTVTVNPDGTYTYTPGMEFDGSDAFVIQADDNAKGRRTGNVLEPRRATGTTALVTVKQGAKPVVAYTFTYAKYAKGLGDAKAVWELHPQALPCLEQAAFTVADAVNPQYQVTLNYELGLLSGELLANASSPSIKPDDPGFYMTVVQDKIIKGTNPNGTTVDGKVNFNFTPSYYDKKTDTDKRAGWSYFGKPTKTQYSFDATAAHELLHSFGFLAGVEKPPCNEFVCNNGKPTKDAVTNWYYFDQLIGNAQQQKAIDGKTYEWDPAFDANVTGDKANGLYFLGDNAVKAYGGPVPLYSPTEFKPSSSISHLADYVFNKTDPTAKDYVKLMNANGDVGEPNLQLSPVEIAMLKDLGYRTKA